MLLVLFENIEQIKKVFFFFNAVCFFLLKFQPCLCITGKIWKSNVCLDPPLSKEVTFFLKNM